MLWIDKHKPNSLDLMDYHLDLSENLKNMIVGGDFPHLLVYGPTGAGKKTRILAILKEIYGPNALKIKIEHKSFKHPTSSKNIDVTMISSQFHIEINPGEAGTNDRLVIQTIIKEIAQSPPIDTAYFGSFKIVVLNEVDKLSKDAQHALRRTMEKSSSVCRLIMCCESTAKVIDPIKSRCLGIRIPAPTTSEMEKVLTKVAKAEKFDIPPKLMTNLITHANGNLRYALLLLEAHKAKGYPFQTCDLYQLDWEKYISMISGEITTDQTPEKLSSIRAKLYELIGHCIPPELIIKNLALELIKVVDQSVKFEIIYWASFYEHRMQLGSKPIFHLEAFVAKSMSLIKKHSSQMK
ncbi:replication factor C subunit [Tieghemostelium lacteum]|uniref:Replication factor C subunit n=1 Tax=Tieghemostelium lacteum TaxID=361077 RepID=A0A151ZHF9_TIELA|nr:replication factor C subunit [Tieghemostelium lacteum]|eukprot:KYQ93418.1 replication factor C subunit [Tieghemostelium lacteum]